MKPKLLNDVLIIGQQGYPLRDIKSVENYPLMNHKGQVEDKTIIHLKDERDFHTKAPFKDVVALINGSPNTLNGINTDKLVEQAGEDE